MVKPNFEKYRQFNSCYDTALIWDYYGYWDNQTNPPEWFTPSFINEAKTFALSLIPHDIQLYYTTHSNGKSFNGKCAGGKWVTYDKANKLIFFDNAVGGCQSKKRAEEYILSRHSDHKRLYSGVLDVLLHYKNTGIPCLPNWNTNKIDSFGFKDDKKNKIPRLKELIK